MNAALPPNCISRVELQGLIVRAHEGAKAAQSDELAALLRSFINSAACLDGFLAEQTPQNHPNDKALENPNGWRSEWFGGTHTLHDGDGEFAIRYGQQVLVMHDGHYLGTGRYRLQVGDEAPIVGPDVGLMRASLERALAARPKLDKQTADRVLDTLFTKDAVPCRS